MSFAEDEDLEFLRLAALKSLNPKKESSFSPPKIHRMNEGSIRPTYIPSDRNTSSLNANADPYIPQTLSGGTNWSNELYIPSRIIGSSSIPKNVQLSPRSLAFVAQNNDILMRRKKSPYRSPSPPPYRESRWSESPPPLKNNIPWTDRRSPNFKKNRSPNYRRSPRRSISRSPLPSKNRFSRSPPINSQHNRIGNRSPIRRDARKGYRKTLSRSPAPLPNNLHQPNYEPANKFSTGRHFTRSQSPNNRKSPPLLKGSRKRTRSPYEKRDTTSVNNQKITRSPPPRRRRKSRELQSRRRSPQRSYNNKNDYYNKKNNRNTYRNDRDVDRNNRKSPIRKRSRSKSPQPTSQNKENKKIQNETVDKEKVVEAKVKEVSSTENSKEITEMSEDQIERNLLNSSSDNESKSSDDSDEDEIDLFASEESESENEGRFKSSGSKAERTSSATISFSSLGTSSSTSIGELKEVGSSENKRSSRNNYSNGRSERDSGYSRSRNNGDWKSRSSNSRSLRIDNSRNKEDKSGELKMFKSTFQAINDIPSKVVVNVKPETPKPIVKESSIDKKESSVSSEISSVSNPASTASKKSIHLRLGPASNSSSTKKINEIGSSINTTSATTSTKIKKSWRTDKFYLSCIDINKSFSIVPRFQ